MKAFSLVGALMLLLAATLPGVMAQSSTASVSQKAALEREKAAIRDVIERQASTFWAKDFQGWANTWVHAPYIHRSGWSEAGGVSNADGWEAIGGQMQKHMAENPKPNLTPAKIERDHFTFRIHSDVAWVTFEQHGVSTGEPQFDMPGLSHETRIFEKHEGKWKVVYLGYLLAGNPMTKAAR